MAKPDEYDPQEVVVKLAALDAEQKGLSQRIDQLGGEVQRGFASIYARLEAMSERSAAKAATNWGTLAAWATVVLGLGSAIGYMALRPVEQHLERLDTTLQREMRQLDDALQRELNERLAGSERVRTVLIDQMKERQEGVTQRLLRIEERLGNDSLIERVLRLEQQRKP